MTCLFKLLGKDDIASRLLGSMQVDSNKDCVSLDWTTAVDIGDQLAKMSKEVRW